ncbi:MAG: FAD-dependent monooxygenase, partial [Flavobacteriales bacterium]|nr:FAD-dependent monooxygenase [Flavobacteriales bacterium]
MKAVIIGGGIAGLSAAILLRKNNWEVVINEKRTILSSKGLAFLIHPGAIEIIKSIDEKNEKKLLSRNICSFNLKNTKGDHVKSIPLYGWQAIKRIDILGFLCSLLPEHSLIDHKDFSHFIYEKGKAIAAAFSDGSVEYGDLFIGADGGHSLVRRTIFGEVEYTKTEVKEIVCIVKGKDNQIENN